MVVAPALTGQLACLDAAESRSARVSAAAVAAAEIRDSPLARPLTRIDGPGRNSLRGEATLGARARANASASSKTMPRGFLDSFCCGAAVGPYRRIHSDKFPARNFLPHRRRTEPLCLEKFIGRIQFGGVFCRKAETFFDFVSAPRSAASLDKFASRS